jgi:HK97 family phage prohead protease
MTNDIESKPFSFMTDTLKWSSVETKGGVDQYVEGDITTDDPDLDDDIVTQKGLNKVFEQLTQQDIMLDLEHDTYRDEEGIPRARAMNNIAIGRIVDKRKDEHGVWVKAKLNPYVQSFKSVWESIKAGFIKAFSITFKTVASRTKTVGDTTYRLIDDLNILNVALTSCPINPKATFIPAFKSYIKNNTQPEEKSSVEETKMTDEEKIETPEETPKATPKEEIPKESEEKKEEPEQKSEEPKEK